MAAGDINVSVENPQSNKNWNRMILNFRGSTVFHTSNWAKLLSESYGYHPSYLTIWQEGSMKACLPITEINSFITGKRGVCVSFSDYCQAITNSSDDFSLLLKSAMELGRISRWQYLELRGEKYITHATPVISYMHDSISLIDDPKQMQSKLRKGTASSIKKAEKEGVTIEMTDTIEALRSFYELHCMTRKRHGVPPQPYLFFAKLHEHLLSEGLGLTALAKHQGNVVAGLVCLFFGDSAVWKYGASDERFKHLSGNNLVLWETIKLCARKGFRSFSLGRTDLDNAGLLSFKSGWGGERTLLNYYRYDLNKKEFMSHHRPQNNWTKKMFKAFPIEVLKVIGRVAYRHIG